MPQDTSIAATLNERDRRYGVFKTHAEIAQALKDVMRSTEGWARLSADQRESLEMQAHKQARILNGDPNYADNWHDIAGYAKLVEDVLVTDSFVSDLTKEPTVVETEAAKTLKDSLAELETDPALLNKLKNLAGQETEAALRREIEEGQLNLDLPPFRHVPRY